MHINAMPQAVVERGAKGWSVGRAIPDAALDAAPFGTDPGRLVADAAALGLPQTPSLLTIGNGFVGVRGPGEADGAPRVYLNGIYEVVPIRYHEGAYGYARESDTRLAAADATRPLILVDGAALPPPASASLNLETGVLTTTHPCGAGMVTVEQFAAMARASIVATRISAAGLHGRVTVRPRIGAPPGTQGEGPPGQGGLYDPRLTPQLEDSPWVAVAAGADEDSAWRGDRLRRSGFVVAAWATVARSGAESWTVMSAYAAIRDDELAAANAANIAATDASAAGFDALLAEQRDWYAAHWAASAVTCPDAPLAQQALRHAQLQLVQAVGRDGARSIGAKGQSGEGYEGHVFWDADLYVLPMFALTRPDIARAMLVWRIGGLDAARENARAMGQARGALYPWRTIGGRECSSFFPAGSAQYHINADIAHALRLYLDATGDESLLDEGGAEMLVETARIWLQIGYHDPARGGAFVINRVTGPDEYSALVDNNLYTNLMAAAHLRHAAEVGAARGLLEPGEGEAMAAAADAMLLPHDDARQIYAQDEGFFAKQPWPFDTTPDERYPLLLHHHPLLIYRHQVAKQADAVLALALMPERFDPVTRARMIDAYEAVTVHDSTLSASAFATALAGVGEVDRAWRYWRAAALTDLHNLFGNSDHGLHMAALAGSWTALAFGFAGVAIRDGHLTLAPVAVPGLGRYTLRLRVRGSLIEVAVAGEEAGYRLIEGAPVTLLHHGRALTVGPASCAA
jgi:alpha,alpha-trehalose phosphorylase